MMPILVGEVVCAEAVNAAPAELKITRTHDSSQSDQTPGIFNRITAITVFVIVEA